MLRDLWPLLLDHYSPELPISSLELSVNNLELPLKIALSRATQNFSRKYTHETPDYRYVGSQRADLRDSPARSPATGTRRRNASGDDGFCPSQHRPGNGLASRCCDEAGRPGAFRKRRRGQYSQWLVAHRRHDHRALFDENAVGGGALLCGQSVDPGCRCGTEGKAPPGADAEGKSAASGTLRDAGESLPTRCHCCAADARALYPPAKRG